MQICFFDDELCSNFKPLTLTRPVDDLRTGILTMAEKWMYVLDEPSWSRCAPSALKDVFFHLNLDESRPSLWINSRYLPAEDLVDKIQNLNKGTCLKTDDVVIAAHVDADTTQRWIQNEQPNFNALLVVATSDSKCIRNLWDLFLKNEEEINADLERMDLQKTIEGDISPHAVLENNDQIHVAKGAKIEAGAILMAQDGPIYIGEGATVMAGALIRGPVAICKNATVKMSAKISHGTTLGPECKVGGEVDNSIFHSYSNKAHDGYVGDSLIGQWCNLGADTNTSNLKNNYSTIRITDWESREEIESDQQFLGAILGDHTKTAINTQLNTGTVCGVSCNIFSGDFPPKFIPSFSWVGSNVIQPYKIEKALETMEAMMARRDVKPSEEYKSMMRDIFHAEHS